MPTGPRLRAYMPPRWHHGAARPKASKPDHATKARRYEALLVERISSRLAQLRKAEADALELGHGPRVAGLAGQGEALPLKVKGKVRKL